MAYLNNKYFRYLIYIFLTILTIFYIGKLDYIINPASQIISMILSPVLIGGFLYYLLRPMVNYLTNKINNKIAAIILTILVILFLWNEEYILQM